MLEMREILVGCLFGTPVFKWQETALRPPTRKTMALLCYLAIQQRAVGRRELTELLWECGNSRNLRRELYRLKQLPGAKNWLQVSDSVSILAETDLNIFKEALEQQQPQKALKICQGGVHKQFLTGLEPQNAPVFMDWLETERTKLDTLLVDVLQKHVEELEHADKLFEAIKFSRKLLEHDPLNESAHRKIMELEFKQGNLIAAAKQYEICCHILYKELAVTPLPATLELARAIEDAIQQPLPQPAAQINIKTKYHIPPKVLRPPILVGREKEWAKMEAAWQAGKAIIIAGAAGSGKTRLMMDFIHSKNIKFGLTYGCPGDKTVPYSSAARPLKIHSDCLPKEAFEPWVRCELARLAPEKFLEKPLPIHSLESRLRFFQAYGVLFEIALQKFAVLLTDDMHYYDENSVNIGNYAFNHTQGKIFSGRHILCYRKEEMFADYDIHYIKLAEQGLTTYINLLPLDLDAITKLLISFDIPKSEQLAPYFYNLTGGNPQFTVEVLKSLYEQGWQGQELPEKINLPQQVSFTIEKRLRHLSKDALKLVRVMAVLKESTGVKAKHLAEIVAMDYLKTCEVLVELEHAYIIKDGLFVHDLLAETVFNAIPAVVYPALNYNIAKWLETQDSAPVRIAYHWIEADELEQALPWCIKAAETLLLQGELEQANTWLEKVFQNCDPEEELYKQAKILQLK